MAIGNRQWAGENNIDPSVSDAGPVDIGLIEHIQNHPADFL